jgi:hypothetical protein
MLMESPLAEDLAGADASVGDVSKLREALQQPRGYALPARVIETYEKWLYPGKGVPPYQEGYEELEWRVWHDPDSYGPDW